MSADAAAAQLGARRWSMASTGGPRSWPIDDEQGRAQPVAFAQRGELARLGFEPRALERQRDLVEQVVEQRQLLGRHRRRAVVAREADRGDDRVVRADRVELPFGRLTARRTPRPAGSPVSRAQRGGGDVARRQA